MARPTLNRNPKYLTLIKRLGLPRYSVRGLLDELWDACHESGNPIIRTHQVEPVAGWDGEPEVLVTALIEEGFLDKRDDGSVEVHDYWDHAPDYVLKRKQREDERKRKTTLRKKIERRTTADNGGQRQTSAENGSPPTLTPSLTPTLINSLSQEPEKEIAEQAEATPEPEKPTAPPAAKAEVSRPAWMSPQDDMFQDLPQVLAFPRFRGLWLRWEIYQHDKLLRTFQPIQRAPAWSFLLERAPPGKELGYCCELINQALASNWHNLRHPEEHRGSPRRHANAAEKAQGKPTRAPGGGRREGLTAPSV